MLSNVKKTPRGITFVLGNERTLKDEREPRKCQTMLGKCVQHQKNDGGCCNVK